MRNPDPDRDFGEFYAATLEQIAWAESLGIDSVWLSEHHFCDDGYTPSPLVVAAAIGHARSATTPIDHGVVPRIASFAASGKVNCPRWR